MRASAELGTPDWSDPQPASVSPSHKDEGNATLRGGKNLRRRLLLLRITLRSPLALGGERGAVLGREAGAGLVGGRGAPGLGLSVWRVHAGSGRMNGGAEVNGVGGGLETSPNSTGCGRRGLGLGRGES